MSGHSDEIATHRSGGAPHAEDCDSLDCPCYRNGQDDVLMALRVLDRMGMTEARDRILASEAAPPSDSSGPR